MRLSTRHVTLGAALTAWALLAVSPLWAAARVELEVIADARSGAALGFQEWMQTLTRAGVKNVALRTAQAGDQIKIDERGTADSPTYAVTALLDGNVLVLPGGVRFKRGEEAKVAQWLDDLAEHGPPNRREARAAFGLTAKQLAQAREDLAKPVGFSTKGMSRAEAVEKIGRRLKLPIQLAGALPAAEDDKIAEDVSGLSCGTGLACILRPLGYCMVPRLSAGGLEYVVAKAKLDQEVWPIGWKPEKPPAEVLPKLFKFLPVNVQNVPAAKFLKVIGTQLETPVLMDYNAMARHGIDPAKALVSMPPGKTTYSSALRRLLFKAGLKFEVRLDEAGRPFLWITTVKPV
jgi:hypothetical protein